jgi:hypothetical protein
MTRGEIDRMRPQMCIDDLDVERAHRARAQIIERPREGRECPDHAAAAREDRDPRAARVDKARLRRAA